MQRQTLLLFWILCFFSSAAFADELPREKLRQISQSRGWLKLLHFERNPLGLLRSQISDSRFFFAPNGYKDSEAEILATMVAFQKSAREFETLEKGKVDHSQHAQCRFPARLQFLRDQLPEMKDYWATLPTVNCLYLGIYREALQAHSISFVFSSYYADSPGSAFGHTFFRINKKVSQGQTRQELLDYGTGFAANVTVTNPALYAIFGLTGGFTGSWTNLPYYYKVREYNDYEARDLWSYELDLTRAEVQTLVDHLWEVGPHAYTYYFFTQNCAFHMLTLLEAAAPRLNLIEHVPLYVMPVDSLKALFQVPGLVTDITFRPSLRRTFLARAEAVPANRKKDFESYALNGEWPQSWSTWPAAEQATFLDASLDLQDLRHPEAALNPASKSFQDKEYLLRLRASNPIVTAEPKIPTLEDEHPEKSHGSSRAGLSWSRQQSQNRGFLEYRFALHDLQDPTQGLPSRSQLEFFNFQFEMRPAELRLQDLQVFQVFNLNPWTYFERKPSWGVRLGVESFDECENPDYCYAGGMQFQYGLSIERNSWIPWVMAVGQARYGESLKKNRLLGGAGVEVGLLYRSSTKSSVLTKYSHQELIERNPLRKWELQYRWSPRHLDSWGLLMNDSGYGLIYYRYL